MTLTPEAREAGAKACYESWVGGVEGVEPAWADLPESHRERMRASFEAGASALAAHRGERVAVPEGFKLVPIEPTPDMLQAAEDTGFTGYNGAFHIMPDTAYAAMLAAAPEPPSTADLRKSEAESIDPDTGRFTQPDIYL